MTRGTCRSRSQARKSKDRMADDATAVLRHITATADPSITAPQAQASAPRPGTHFGRGAQMLTNRPESRRRPSPATAAAYRA
jgi:hypothetical protein